MKRPLFEDEEKKKSLFEEEETTQSKPSFDDLLADYKRDKERNPSLNTFQMQPYKNRAAQDAVNLLKEQYQEDKNNLPDGAFDYVNDNRKTNALSKMAFNATKNAQGDAAKQWHNITSGTKDNTSELLQSKYNMDKEKADYYEEHWNGISEQSSSADKWYQEKDDIYNNMSDQERKIVDATYEKYTSNNPRYANGGLAKIKELGYDPQEMMEYMRRKEARTADASRKERVENASGAQSLGQNVASVAATLGQPLDLIDQAYDTVTGLPYDTSLSRYTNYKEDVRNTTSENIKNSASNKGVGNVLSFMYQTGMSIADSATAMLVGNGIGEAATLGIMSSGAAASAYSDAIERGATEQEAGLTAFANGVFEALFEKVSLENFIDLTKGAQRTLGKDVIKRIAKQAGIEGSEELFTSIADAIADAVINGENSEYNVNKQNYILNGEDPETAAKKAREDFIKQLALDFAGGVLSGGAFGIAGTAIGNHNATRLVDTMSEESKNNLFEVAKNSELTNDSTAKDLANSVENVNDLSDKQQRQMLQSLEALENADIKNSINIALESKISNEDTLNKARALLNDYVSTDMSEQEFNERLVNQVAKNSTERNAILEARNEALTVNAESNPIVNAVNNVKMDRQIDIENKAIQKEITKQDKEANKNYAKFEKAVSSKEKYAAAKGVAQATVTNGKEESDSKVLGISSLRGTDNTTVVLEGGKTTQLKNVNFSDQNFGKLYNEVASTLTNADIANQALTNYKGQEVESYVDAYRVVYELGRQASRTNKDASWLLNNALDSYIVSNMGGASIASEVFYKGKNDAENYKATKEAANGKSENKTYKNKSNAEDLLKTDSEIKHLIAAISDKTGVKITEINAIKDNNGNYNTALLGSFFDNVISLNADGKNEVQTLLHEVMEKMKSENQEGYNLIVNQVIEYVQSTKGSKALIDNLQKYQRAYAVVEGLSSTEEIADEYANDFVSGVLTSSEGLTDLASWASKENPKKAKNLFEAIADFFNRILDELTSYMDSHKANMNQGARDGFEATGKQIEALRKTVLAELDKMGQQNGQTVNEATNKKSYSVNVDSEKSSIREQIKNNIDVLSKMDDVDIIEVPNNFTQWSKDKVVKWAIDSIKDKGTEIDKQNFGIIIYDKKRIEGSIKYFYAGDIDLIAYKSIPKILKKGIVISNRNNHKGRDYSTETIAAPIKIIIPENDGKTQEKRLFVGVVVKETNHFYYKVHRALISDIEILEDDKKTESTSDGGVTVSSSLATSNDSASEKIISNAGNNATDSQHNTEDILKNIPEKKTFSVNVPVEQTKDLIAVHNLYEDKLLKALKYDGLPMPSIAITKASIGHTNFGEISFVFGKETIDPKNKKNKVYGADAWTPTFPRIEYEPNFKRIRQIKEELKPYFDYVPERFRSSAEAFFSGIEYNLDNYGGKDGIIERALTDTAVKELYLATLGKTVDPVNTVSVKEMNQVQIEISKKMIEALGEDNITDIAKGSGKDILNNYGYTIKKTLIDYFSSQNGIDIEEANQLVDGLKNLQLVTYVRQARDYKNNGGRETIEEYNFFATRQAVDDAINQDDYKEWLEKTFTDISLNEGIRNGVEELTDNGRRTFKQTHYPVTAENIVKSMIAQANGNVRNDAGYHGVKSVRAVAVDEFKSISDIKKSSDKLQNLSEEEFTNIQDKLQDRLDAVMKDIINASDHGRYLEYEIDNLGYSILDIASKPSVESIKKELNTYAWKVTDIQAQEIVDIINAIKEMPVNMFEAKPLRVVNFNEGQLIVPDNISDKLRKALQEKEISYLEYEAGNQEARKSLVNSLEDRKFAVEVDDDLSIFESVLEENEALNEANNVIKNTVKSLDNINITPTDVKKIASAIKAEYKTNASIQDITDTLSQVFNYMNEDNVDYNSLVQIMSEVAKPMLENVTDTNSTRSESWDKFYQYLTHTKFRLSPGQIREVVSIYGSTEGFRKKLFGVTTVSKDAISTLDDIWSELVEASGNTLPAYVSDADMPAVLLSTIDGMKPQALTQNTYGMNLEQASYDLALDIYRRFFEVLADNNKSVAVREAVKKVKDAQFDNQKKAVETYKKKLEEQKKLLEAEKQKNIKALAAELKADDEALSEALAKNDEVAAAVIEDLKNKNAKKLEQVRKQRDDQIAKIKAKNFDARKNERDRKKNTALKEQLRNQTNALNRMLKSPNVAQFVKVSMVNQTIDVLEAINLDTGKSQGMREKLQKLSELYERYKSDSTFNFDYDESTANMIKELRDTFEGRNYTELSNDELQRVVELVQRLKAQIQNANKLLQNEKYNDAAKAATDIITEVSASKGSLDSKLTKDIDKYLSYQLNAYRWFRKTSGYKDGALMNVYDQLDKGQLKMIQMQKEINDMFAPLLEGKENQENVKKLSSIDEKDLVDIGLKVNGKPYKVTRGMMLSYLMHIQNMGNARHMVLGGFTIPDFEAYSKGKMADAYEKTVIGEFYSFQDIKDAADGVKVNKKDASFEDGVNAAIKVLQGRSKKLRANLSEWELSYLETAEKLFHEYYGEKINEVSVETRGYALASVKNYYPIKTDTKFTRTEFAALKKDGSLEGMGFLKERVKASNPIMLEDISNVILRQTDNTSRYYGFSIPVRNVNMVMQMKFNNKTSPEAAISDKWGTYNLKLFEKIMQDVQTGRGTDDGVGQVFTALRGNFAAATLTANVGVAMKQAASYPTAAAVLGWKPLGKAFTDISKGLTKKGIPELEEINPLLWYRSKGQSSADINYAKQSDIYKYLDKKAPAIKAISVDLIQNIDSATVRTLEYASKYYVDENFKELEKGSEEYWNKVSEVFTKVVEETQPNYTVLQRPEVLKDPNALVRQLFMFKTQPLQNLGIIYDALGEFNAVKKAYAKDSTEYKVAADKVAKAVSSQLVAAAVFSAMTVLANVLYHKLYKYDKDDDKSMIEEIALAFAGGMASTLSGMLIAGDWIYNELTSLLFGSKNYGVEVSIIENINNTFTYFDNYKNYGKKLVEAQTETETQKAINSLIQNTEDVFVSFGQYIGIPVNNIKNTFAAPYLYIKDIINDVPLGSSQLAWDESVDSMNMKMFEALTDGDMERYNKLFNQQVKASDAKDPEKSIKNKMKSMIKESYDNKEIDANQALKYLDAANIEYDASIIDEWDYKLETGATSYSKYSRMNDAIKNSYENNADRTAITTEIKKLLKDGTDKGDIASTITRNYKSIYLENKSADLKNLLITCYMACGYTREEALKRINSWK